jgi:hypothetical protein
VELCKAKDKLLIMTCSGDGVCKPGSTGGGSLWHNKFGRSEAAVDGKAQGNPPATQKAQVIKYFCILQRTTYVFCFIASSSLNRKNYFGASVWVSLKVNTEFSDKGK